MDICPDGLDICPEHLLSRAKFAAVRRVIESVVAGAEGAAPVWVGVRAYGTANAVEQAKVAEDLPHNIYNNPKVIEAYLGREE